MPTSGEVFDMASMVEDIVGQPNLTMESHFDYGTRAGYWRIVRVLKEHGATEATTPTA